MIDDELERGGVVEVDEKSEAFLLGPTIELRLGHSGELGKIGVEFARGGLQRSVVHRPVAHLLLEQAVECRVALVESVGGGSEHRGENR